MSAWANITGTWRQGVLWQNVGGAWRKITPWLNVGGTWNKDPNPSATALLATASPLSVAGAISRPSAGIATTNEATVSVTGGAAPFSYAWSAQDGLMTATLPTAASTRFMAEVEPGSTASDNFTCLVTDANGQTASVVVAASVANYGRPSNA
jgi:hypothetical protein